MTVGTGHADRGAGCSRFVVAMVIDGVAAYFMSIASLSAYRKYDIEAWMPGRNAFGEVPGRTLLCNTMQYNTIQYNTIQYNTIQYNTIQFIQYPLMNATDLQWLQLHRLPKPQTQHPLQALAQGKVDFRAHRTRLHTRIHLYFDSPGLSSCMCS